MHTTMCPFSIGLMNAHALYDFKKYFLHIQKYSVPVCSFKMLAGHFPVQEHPDMCTHLLPLFPCM